MRLIEKQISEGDAERKAKSQSYADKRRGATQSNLTVGDQVLGRRPKRNKLTPRFILKPYEITDIKGTTITDRRKEHQITRNCCHFKLVTGSSNAEISDNESEETDENAVNNPNIEEVQGREDVGRENAEPAVDHQGGQRRYPQRRRHNPLFYQDEQFIR